MIFQTTKKIDNMYELVKKKNIAVRILIGIAILFAITQTLKFFLKEPALNINDELVKTANEINKHAPIVIDSLTTFDNVNALKGNVFQYNYTINVDKSIIDTSELKKLAKESLIDQLKKNPKATYFRENNIEIQAIMRTKMECKFVRLLCYQLNINYQKESQEENTNTQHEL
jgi:hypothetical protein